MTRLLHRHTVMTVRFITLEGDVMPTTPSNGWPYPTVIFDGFATVDEEGENQSCECGNDSRATDWSCADRTGRLTFDATASSDPAEFAVCPECGRIYSNENLFAPLDGKAAAVARYDTVSPAFIADLRRYNHDAYAASE